VTKVLKLYLAINEREECEVTTHAHVLARVDASTALANEDVSSADFLAVESLYSATLGV
jgi:hypothetical protein